jgi:rhodanese-related sulfurtransferase
MSAHSPVLSRRSLMLGFGLAVPAAAFWSCSARSEPVTVTRDAVKAGLADGSIILIDVREADEFAASHIPGAISVPLSTLDPAKLPKQDGKRVVLYCHSGRRAGLAQAEAEAAGRTDITAVYAGSMNDWLAAGEPVAR